MFLKKSLIAFCVALCLAAFSVNSFACACCAETGTYMLWTGKPSEHEMNILQEMKFHESAFLYMTEAGFDGIKGLDSIQKSYESDSWTASPEFFSLNNIFAAKTWKFNFKTKDGKAGTLTLPMPVQMLQYKVDIHDGSDQGLGPLLYKEWRFKGNVQSGTGFFQAGIAKPTTYFLVLQGRGRGCDDLLDFAYWRLEISGKKADYAFFGKLSSGDPSLFEDAQEEEEEQPKEN